MKTISTPLFPFLEKHSATLLKKLPTQGADEIEIENHTEIIQLLIEDTLLAPGETSVNIIMDYARQKLY